MAERFEIDLGVADVLRDFAQLRDVLGSSSSTAGELSLLGGGLGIGDIRGAAEALHRATLSGQGMATAARFGLQIRPNEIGFATDRGAMLMQALEGLRATARGPGGMSAAIADARNLNLEDWLGVVYLMDEQFQRIKEEALATADIYSPDRIAAATMLNFETARLNMAWKDLTVTIGSLVVPVLADFVGWLADIARWGSSVGNEATGASTSGGSLSQSMNNLGRAIDRNTSVLRQTAGMWGGGPRAAGAIPGAFGPGRGFMIDDNIRALAKGLGAYSVNF
jgi:hypothetical protein